MFMYYYTVCYFTCIFYAVVRQISMWFINNKDSVFCIRESKLLHTLGIVVDQVFPKWTLWRSPAICCRIPQMHSTHRGDCICGLFRLVLLLTSHMGLRRIDFRCWRLDAAMQEAYHGWRQSPHNYAAHNNISMKPRCSCWCQCVNVTQPKVRRQRVGILGAETRTRQCTTPPQASVISPLVTRHWVVRKDVFLHFVVFTNET